MSVIDLPAGLWLAYYGDDFTGSTDAMEAMTLAGVPTVLCLTPPKPGSLQQFGPVRCVGLAGSARGRSPDWMDAQLPGVFQALASLGAPILHYKICSTFDSSPEVGSIGRAIDLGLQTVPSDWSPVVVGAPKLRRYQAFGHLFASTANGQTYRLDRHPTMSRHPVTPMAESDLLLHLSRQTTRNLALLDVTQLKAGQAHAVLQTLKANPAPAVFVDVLDQDTLVRAGELIWCNRGQGLFSASSSGLSYALTAYWRQAGYLPEPVAPPLAKGVEAIAVVSGSCSPVTAAQIAWARTHDFLTLRLDLSQALRATGRTAELARLMSLALPALRRQQSVVIFSAQGPDDASVIGFDDLAKSSGLSRTAAAQVVGQVLAQAMQAMLDETGIKRAVVAGGDSSGEVASTLGIDALTMIAQVAPGAPLCKAWSKHPGREGLELVLKGGQMGGPDFFGLVRDGLSTYFA